MAERKYLDYDGLVQVSGEIKSRVKSEDSLPVSAPAGAAYLYVGEDTENYKKGHTYQYQTNSWVDITPPTSTFNDEDFSVDAQNEVSLLPARRVYHATRAAWDLLSVAEKTQYGATAFTDDEGVIGRIKSKTFSGTSDNNGFLLINDDFYANKVVVLGVSYPSGTPPYRVVPIVSTNGNKWFLNVGDLLTGESLANITITNATVYYVEI